MSTPKKVWLTRAGRHGEDEEFALENNLAIIRFREVQSLEDCKDYNDVLRKVEEAYPDAKPRARGNFAGQLWAFVLGMQEDDLVVLPLKHSSQIALGRVKGPYRFAELRGEVRHSRAIEWIRTDIPRTAFHQDLLHSFGAFMTVCNISRNDAERRVAVVATGKDDPGPSIAETSTTPSQAPPRHRRLRRRA